MHFRSTVFPNRWRRVEILKWVLKKQQQGFKIVQCCRVSSNRWEAQDLKLASKSWEPLKTVRRGLFKRSSSSPAVVWSVAGTFSRLRNSTQHHSHHGNGEDNDWVFPFGQTLQRGFCLRVHLHIQQSHKSFNYGELHPQPRQLYSQCVLWYTQPIHSQPACPCIAPSRNNNA